MIKCSSPYVRQQPSIKQNLLGDFAVMLCDITHDVVILSMHE